MSSEINNYITRSYNKKGYVILNIFNKNEIDGLKKKIKKKSEIILKKKKWNLSLYHTCVDDDQNQKITDQKNRFINVNNKIINKINKNRHIKNILQNKWDHSKFLIPDQKYLIGKTKKTSFKNIKKNEIPFRIVRPHKKKKYISAAPPPHVDVNATRVDKKKNKGQEYIGSSIQFTLWLPLIGFSKKYTLRLAPGSHKFNHPVNTLERNKKYVSSVFSKKYIEKFKFKRLNLKKGQAVLFDDNLIHGSSLNMGKITRISMEFRLYNFKKVKLSK